MKKNIAYDMLMTFYMLHLYKSQMSSAFTLQHLAMTVTLHSVHCAQMQLCVGEKV